MTSRYSPVIDVIWLSPHLSILAGGLTLVWSIWFKVLCDQLLVLCSDVHKCTSGSVHSSIQWQVLPFQFGSISSPHHLAIDLYMLWCASTPFHLLDRGLHLIQHPQSVLFVCFSRNMTWHAIMRLVLQVPMSRMCLSWWVYTVALNICRCFGVKGVLNGCNLVWICWNTTSGNDETKELKFCL